MKKGIALAIAMLMGAALGVSAAVKIAEKNLVKITEISEKHLRMFFLMNQWVKIKQKGNGLESYFQKKGYRKIAIYGMSHVGETLVGELKGTSIQIAYGIDRNSDSFYSNIHMIMPEDSFDEVDAVVVTAISYFDDIKEQLRTKIKCPIVSLEDILDEI